jgi:hypothetical protein
MINAEPQVCFNDSSGQQPPATLLLDQYKAYLSDLGNIGTRYTTAQTFYWTIVSALIGLVALKDIKTNAEYFKPAIVVVVGLIAIICCVWQFTSGHYRKLFGAKIAILKQLEEKGLYTLYKTEGDILRKGSEKVPSLLAIERVVPLILMFVAVAFVLYSFYYNNSPAR